MSDTNGTPHPDPLRDWAMLSPSMVPVPPRPRQLTAADILTNADTYVPPPAEPPMTGEGETVLQAIQRLARMQGLPGVSEATWEKWLRDGAIPSKAMARDWESGILRVLMNYQTPTLEAAISEQFPKV